MEMNLAKVLAEEVPYHAHVYPKYYPIKGVSPKRQLLILYKEDLQKEMDDTSEDKDTNDDSNVYHDEEAPIAKIRRAHNADGKYNDYEFGGVCDHSEHNYFVDSVERLICENGWATKDFKIFHIWNISLNKKPPSHWSVKFQRETNEIEVEIYHEKTENGISQAKTKFVKFFLDTQDCDNSLTVTDDDFEMNYSLFSNALRVEFEIRAYNDDGSPALNVNGYVHAYILLGDSLYKEILFDGENKHEKSEHIAARDSAALMLRQSILIIPRGIWDFKLFMSLNNNTDKFEVEEKVEILPRSIAIDEQHYIMGQKGYIIVTVKWACCCVKQGVCVCPSATAIGDIGTFQANYDSGEDSEDTEEDDEGSKDGCQVTTFKEDRTKRTKIDSSSSAFQETI